MKQFIHSTLLEICECFGDGELPVKKEGYRHSRGVDRRRKWLICRILP